ncbi:MAG: NAD(P)-dependent oxidoreductase [Dehalococcoidia bacterium]
MVESPIAVGVIGLGTMGKPMSLNLLRAGFPLVVHNRTAGKADEILAAGGRWGDSPLAVAQQSEVVITMVTDSAAVQDVILGQKGVAGGVRRGSVVVDMSTISPRSAQEIAARLAEQGVLFLDAPVSGGFAGAVQGTLSILVGGDESAANRVLPVLQAMGRNITYMGPSGSGQVTKLVNQILVAVNQSGVAEALVFAAKAGADPGKIIEAVKGGGASSFQLENQGPRMVAGNLAPGFMVKHMLKDLHLILEMAEDICMPLPLTTLVSQLYRSLAADGKAESGTQAIVTVLERLGGQEVAHPRQQ